MRGLGGEHRGGLGGWSPDTLLPMSGSLIAIHIAPAHEAPMEPREAVDLVTDSGIVGDRYFGDKSMDNVTLIEESAVLETSEGVGTAYAPGCTRRNLTVRGIALNDLVGQQFRLGETILEGSELAHPCDFMNQTIGEGARELLANRGGIRARIVQGGTIRRGDSIEALGIPASAELQAEVLRYAG